jgi:hypothetical protein
VLAECMRVYEKRNMSGSVSVCRTQDFEEEQKATFELTRDMTRQYKGMQEELLGRVRRPFLLGFSLASRLSIGLVY